MRKYQIFTRCQRKRANCSWRITRNWKVSWGGSGSGRSIKALPNGLGTGAIKNHHIDLSLLISRVFVKATVNNSLNQRYIFFFSSFLFLQAEKLSTQASLSQFSAKQGKSSNPENSTDQKGDSRLLGFPSFFIYYIWYIQNQLYFKLSLWREIFQ